MNLLTLEFTIDCPCDAGDSRAVLQECEESLVLVFSGDMRREGDRILMSRGGLGAGRSHSFVGGGEVTVVDGSPIRVYASFDQRPSVFVLLGWAVFSFGLVFGLGLADTPLVVFPFVTSVIVYLLSLTGAGSIESYLRSRLGIPEERSISLTGWVVICAITVVGVGALVWWASTGPGAP